MRRADVATLGCWERGNVWIENGTGELSPKVSREDG